MARNPRAEGSDRASAVRVFFRPIKHRAGADRKPRDRGSASPRGDLVDRPETIHRDI
jgi:hypothetical protein